MIGRQLSLLAANHHHITVDQRPVLIGHDRRIVRVKYLQDVVHVLRGHICTQQRVDHLTGQMALRQINGHSLAISVKADILGLKAGQLLLIVAQVNRLAAHAYERALYQLVFLVGNSSGVRIDNLQHIDNSLSRVSRGGEDVYHLAGQVISGQINSRRVAVNIEADVLAFNADRQRSCRSILCHSIAVNVEADDLACITNQLVLLVLQRSVYTAGLYRVLAVLNRSIVLYSAGRKVDPLGFTINGRFLCQHLAGSTACRQRENVHNLSLDVLHERHDRSKYLGKIRYRNDFVVVLDLTHVFSLSLELNIGKGARRAPSSGVVMQHLYFR